MGQAEIIAIAVGVGFLLVVILTAALMSNERRK
jgi:hypothetical protein